MNILVNNFRGAYHADLQVSQIALLTGHNGQGKSSIIEAISAALGGVKQPYDLKKDDIGDLIHDGQEIAQVLIRDGDRETEARWPAGEITSRGRPFRATPFATGATLYSDLTTPERLKVLAEYLKTEPDKAALKAALLELDPDTKDEAVEALWAKTQKLGWDGAYEDEKKLGTELKGAWRQVTKDNYGSKVGGKWRPQGWTDEHEACTVEQLNQELAEAKKLLEGAIGKVAINDTEKAKLEALTKNIPKLKQAVEERELEVSRLAFIKDKAEKDVQKIPVLPDENWPKCPCCNEPLQVMGNNQLKKAPLPISPKERAKIQADLDQANLVFTKALGDWEAAVNSRDIAKKDLRAAEDSKATLEASDPTAVSAKQIQEYRDEIARCESILAIRARIAESLRIHIEITRKIEIVNLLAPEGMRGKRLADVLGKFNQELMQLCTIADWSVISVQPDGSILYNNRKVRMSSGGERMKCDIIMQIALGMRDGSEIFLVDEADILDGVGRNGLFALLQHTGQKAVVAMMLLNRKAAPDLEAAGLGHTYWIEQANALALAA